jgi:hypothetical protein
MATRRRNRQRAKKRLAAKQQGSSADMNAALWPFTALFQGGQGEISYRHERDDLFLARRAIREDWLPADADTDAKRIALVRRFIFVMDRHRNLIDRRNTRLTLTALSCFVACEWANLREWKRILRDPTRLAELRAAFQATEGEV